MQGGTILPLLTLKLCAIKKIVTAEVSFCYLMSGQEWERERDKERERERERERHSVCVYVC